MKLTSTLPTCVKCRNENHAACDGGAWGPDFTPWPCLCSMEDHYEVAEIERRAAA